MTEDYAEGLPMQNVSQSSTPVEHQEPSINQKRSQLRDPPTTRREWIQEFKKNNPNRPAPCSAKAVYRLADRLFCIVSPSSFIAYHELSYGSTRVERASVTG